MDKFNMLFFDTEFKNVCNKLQNLDLKSKTIEFDLKEVIDFITIKNKNVYFKPFKTIVDYDHFYNYIFSDDENGISKYWISLDLSIKFADDNFILNLKTKNDLAIISTNELIQFEYLHNVLYPYSETSLDEKLGILNLRNEKKLFNYNF
jgi:hypothetical protein